MGSKKGNVKGRREVRRPQVIERMARRTGRFPQLVDPRGGINWPVFECFVTISPFRSRARDSREPIWPAIVRRRASETNRVLGVAAG
jgi:hypothetical protein